MSDSVEKFLAARQREALARMQAHASAAGGELYAAGDACAQRNPYAFLAAGAAAGFVAHRVVAGMRHSARDKERRRSARANGEAPAAKSSRLRTVMRIARTMLINQILR